MFTVYIHTFPNGKKYIGQTNAIPEKRWGFNGNGYKTQPKVANAIKKYGWENVTHTIVAESLNKEQADQIEMRLICELDTIKNGYNTAIGGQNILTTLFSSNVMAMKNARKHYWGIDETMAQLDGLEHDKNFAKLINEADRAVRIKHGNFSSTSAMSVAKYWLAITEFFRLDDLICQYGQSSPKVKQYRERNFEEVVYQYFFGQKE